MELITQETRRDARELARRNKEADLLRIFCVLAEAKERGATCDEIEVELGMCHGTASARMFDLRAEGHAKLNGEKRPTRTGANAAVHVVA